MTPYDHKAVEEKWQERWESDKSFRASDDSDKPKFYSLIEFPFPSGDGLHVGHIRSNTAMDVISRKRRAQGYNVLYPIGWDAFGLPTENYAIKTGIHPRIVTKQNTDNFRRQLKALGFSFDWDREVDTSDPAYYKWTQWIFLKLLEKGLAYKDKREINWCPKDKIGLANEEVIDGACERCGTKTEMREKEQWMLAITKYADRLDRDLDTVDFLEKIKIQQRNWIGRSEGSVISYKLQGTSDKVDVFTTRADTLFGVTYLVLAPEHELVEKLKDKISNWDEVAAYIKQAKDSDEMTRTAEGKEKTGVELRGITAINPANGEEVPVWIADYVLAHYGTGAVMAVPAHDQRDWEFAKKYHLPIKEVVVPNIVDKRNPPVSGKKIVERRNIHAIVKDPNSGKYLALKWKKFNWVTFPMGGVENGEDVVQAARREVREETGFTDLKLDRVLRGQVRAEYFAAHKDENRVSYTTAVIFELASNAQEKVSEKESQDHEVVWLNESELTYEHMTHAEVGHWSKKLESDNAFLEDGFLVDSGKFSGVESSAARTRITEAVGGKIEVRYKLRDWVFSRQRYWGEPIPVVHCGKCGIVPVPESELPVLLPDVENYKPTDSGESPLAAIDSWVNTACPTCAGPAKRETDTMPNWAGSSWYFLRYVDPRNGNALADKKLLEKWTPVDWYNGGMEHTTLHLLYSRFWHKFLFDLGVVPTAEPYVKRTSQGLILAPGGEKMSKSKGNVVNPDGIVESLGADALRLYEMFMGPFDQPVAWSLDGLAGTRRFLERVWRLAEKVSADAQVSKPAMRAYHTAVKKVSADIETMKFNTAVSALMVLANELEKEAAVSKELFGGFLQLLSPFVPHIAAELWEATGHSGGIHAAPWPVADEAALETLEADIPVQVNGKVRGAITARKDASEADVVAAARSVAEVEKWLAGKTVQRVIYVPGRLLSFVVS